MEHLGYICIKRHKVPDFKGSYPTPPLKGFTWVFLGFPSLTLTRLPLPGICEVLALEVDTLEDALTKRFGRPASRWLKELEEVRSTGPGLGTPVVVVSGWVWLVGLVGFGGKRQKQEKMGQHDMVWKFEWEGNVFVFNKKKWMCVCVFVSFDPA